ncbi:cellulose binding domain-containing protein [Micromonospora auratinigra]|uniref:Cellulose binding domain-containing protein n=1 Tax=Micromonospora auratinigra TaxID=261654 RepID=A0A1A8ZJV6_9ACTN|nr:cellulose binding domain-containing protein [Micromonospora auratinigra]SBT44118.1 Cellulose binding domain-containing protein [Micromonospora auratinigra]
MSGTRRARPAFGAAIASSPWVVVSIGVVVMVVLLVVALGAARGRRTYADIPPPDATMSLPGPPPVGTSGAVSSSAAAPVLPGLSPRSTVLPGSPTPGPSGTAGGSGRPLPSATTSAAPAPPPAPSPVTGRYTVVNTFDGGFIGEVRLVNTTGGPRGWTVRLTFPRGRLVTSWVDGAEQGVGTFADGVFTYRSGVDLAPGASVPLRFHVEDTGTTRPADCAVDGSACSGL